MTEARVERGTCSIHKNCVLPFLFCFALNAFATSSSVVVTPSRIVIGIDRLGSSHDATGDLSKGDIAIKAALLKGRIAIACVGLEQFWGATESGKPRNVLYDFQAWARHLETQVTADSSIYQLASIMEDESSRTFNQTIGIPGLMKDGTMKQSQSLNRYLVQYIAAGFENKIPLVIQIYYEFDWQHKRLLGPVRQVEFPMPNVNGGIVESAIKCFDHCDTVTQLWTANSKAHQRVVAATPSTLDHYITETMTEPESILLARLLVGIEAEVEPSVVGNGATVVCVPLVGRASITNFKSNPPKTGKPAGRKAEKKPH